MQTTPLLSGLIVLILTRFALFCPSRAFAAPTSGGAGNADVSICSGQLLDRSIVGESKTFDPHKLSIFNSDIAPVLSLADQLPDFGRALRGALRKKWRFGFDGINHCPTENSYFVSTFEKIACQNSGEVIINPDWYERIDSKTCKTLSNADAVQLLKQRQRDLFIHELLLGITLGTDIGQNSVSQVFAALTRQPLPSAAELQLILETSGFGVYGDATGSCVRASGEGPLSEPAKRSVQDSNWVSLLALGELGTPEQISEMLSICKRWLEVFMDTKSTPQSERAQAADFLQQATFDIREMKGMSPADALGFCISDLQSISESDAKSLSSKAKKGLQELQIKTDL